MALNYAPPFGGAFFVCGGGSKLTGTDSFWPVPRILTQTWQSKFKTLHPFTEALASCPYCKPANR